MFNPKYFFVHPHTWHLRKISRVSKMSDPISIPLNCWDPRLNLSTSNYPLIHVIIHDSGFLVLQEIFLIPNATLPMSWIPAEEWMETWPATLAPSKSFQLFGVEKVLQFALQLQVLWNQTIALWTSLLKLNNCKFYNLTLKSTLRYKGLGFIRLLFRLD